MCCTARSHPCSESVSYTHLYCIGDSITYGSGLEDEERLTKSYPAQLGIRLGPRYLIFNYGVRGATLQDLSRKSYRNMGYLNVIEAQSPDVVIIMLGTNDSKQKYWDAERYEEQYLASVSYTHLPQRQHKASASRLYAP